MHWMAATDRRCGYQSLVPWRRTDKGITQHKSPEGSSGVIACQTGRRPADTDSGNMPRHTGDERRFWRQPVSGYPRTDGRGTDQTRSGFWDGGYASHTVRIEKDSLLYKLFETEILPVNSFHHQAVKEVAPGFRVTARSSDGVIEAMDLPNASP